MGIFDIFKRKSPAERNIAFLRQLRKKTIIHESKSKMHDMIVMVGHDSSCLDENPSGEGEFGMVKSNPISVYGIDNIPAYMDKLRYKYTSTSGSGTVTFNHIDFQRTSDSDNSDVGTKKPSTDPIASATSSPNIKGNIDVYNLYSIAGEKLSKIYVNCYALKTSNKVPDGFFHRDEIPAEKDSKVLMESIKNIRK
jgi:hypothetical protein